MSSNDSANPLAQVAAAAAASAKPKKKVMPMDRAHVMDWEPLNLAHPIVSKKNVTLIDLDVQVFGLEEIQTSTRPIAVIMVSHGWANKARDMHPMASGLIGEARRLDKVGGRRRTRDVLVVTVDQRNHGTRRRIKDDIAFNKYPRQFAIYMSMAVTGGMHDHQLIMDFLQSQLFPNDEREIVEYMTTGFSMGGHVGWRLLRHDPRVKIGVPICSVPSEELRRRLLTGPLPPGTTDSHVPKDVLAYFHAPCAEGAYRGKKILTIFGGLDNIMPYTLGEARWNEIVREAEVTDRWIDPDFGHVVSPGMVARAAEWLWRWGLTEP